MVSHTQKGKMISYRYHTNAHYADDLVLLAGTSPSAKFLLHSLKQEAGVINIYVNANKAEFIYFKWKGAISTLSGKPLKVVDQFTYLGCNISSTECDVNICLAKAWASIDRLFIIRKSDLFEKRKQDFFPTVAIFTNPSAQAGYDTRSVFFKRSLTGLNSEFSFS